MLAAPLTNGTDFLEGFVDDVELIARIKAKSPRQQPATVGGIHSFEPQECANDFAAAGYDPN
ncbi:hypothetical protein BHMPCIPO_06244 [Ensifer sesbaniae]|nr:hypothetical protein [Ensifer sesbaniae]